MAQYQWFTIQASKYGDGYTVHGFKEAPKGSVLEGQMLRCYVAEYPTVEEAQAAYPDANFGSEWTDPQVSLNHLPGEGSW